MAKIEAYKFINPGMAADNASEGSLVGRKLVLSFNHFGKTLNSIGSVVKDIENIEISRIKDDELREKLERRQAQRDRDQDAEDATEMAKLDKPGDKNPNKSKIKGFFGKSKLAKGLMSALPLWAKALQPVFNLILQIFKIAVIKEMLEWWADPENKEKIETFFYKANVIFKKLKEFSNWLVNEKLVGGWQKLTGQGSDFGERIQGLGDLLIGVGVAGALLSPFSTFGVALIGLGWLVKNITNWLKDPFAFLRKGKGPGGPKNPNKTPKKTSVKQQLKNKYSKFKSHLKNQSKVTHKINGVNVTVKGKTPIIQSIVKKKSFWQGLKSWTGKGWKFLKQNPLKSGQQLLKKPAVKGGLAGIAADIIVDQTVMRGIDYGFDRLRDRNVNNDIKKHGVDKVISGLERAIDKEANLPNAPWWNLGYKLVGVHYDERRVQEFQKRLAIAKKEKSKIDGNFPAAIQQIIKKDDTKKSSSGNWLTNLFSPKKQTVQPSPKTEEKKSNWLSNLFGNKSNVVTPKSAPQTKKKTTSKKWWEFWKDRGGKTLKPYFFGKIFKGITKTVGSVFNGVKDAVGSVINTVSSVVSNPLVSTALSFVPGVGPIIQGINAFNALRQGNIMGAVMSGVGAMGSFANINTVNAISQPRWMQNLRFSKFGQGVANMYHSGANAWAGLTSGVNNFMGSKWGSLAKGVYQGATGGGWGGALQAGGNILGMNDPGGMFGKGGFFGEGGRMANMGNWLQEHNLSGIGNMFPGLAGLANSIPGFSNLPGIQDIFAGGFSPMQAIGGLAEKNGMGGIYKSAMGLLGGGDMYTGLKELAGEIGVSPEALGAVEKGKSLYERAKGVALQKDPVEILPVLMPIIQDQIVMTPQIKEKAVMVYNAANSFRGRL